MLYDSKVPIKGFNKHEFKAATVKECKVNRNKNTYSDDVLEKLYNLALDIQYILEYRFNNKPTKCFKEQYLTKLKEHGLANITGRIKQKELLENFVDYYGDKFLKLVQSDIDIHSNYNWLTELVRNNKKTSHPIRHLLLIRFLGISIHDLFNQKFEYEPFGQGPWSCLNPAADHYLQNTIKDIDIKYSADSKSPQGIFKCACGFTYVRNGPDRTIEDKYKISRVKQYGCVWESKLKHFAELGLSLREIARKLKVDPATVNKYAAKLGIDKGWKTGKKDIKKKKVSIFDENIKNNKRKEWLQLQSKYPNKSKTELRKLNKGLYMWLYRNDRQWLDANSPNCKEVENNFNRIDWEERDKEIYYKVKKAVSKIEEKDGKPKRITVSLIGSELGIKSLLEKHLDKLPMTKKYLDTVVDDIRDYQIKRIKWAIKEMKKENEEIKIWKVLRKAGIRNDYRENLKSKIFSLIKEHTKRGEQL
ncbi:TnsD family Tn7-like transposition protein [Caminicella sporogenes]|uniref:TnsD family Tn7-like transposition protein n=1 Tax=Caminicella sporogenes TaxID=166485 RepID=UPI00254017C8|nr:TnsD family Tn7-like transposition protein [Caminicella sporogenes]WIF95475.1 TnsD family Tn7-like transposition protein [Caminicella sporogenes]